MTIAAIDNVYNTLVTEESLLPFWERNMIPQDMLHTLASAVVAGLLKSNLLVVPANPANPPTPPKPVAAKSEVFTTPSNPNFDDGKIDYFDSKTDETYGS